MDLSLRSRFQKKLAWLTLRRVSQAKVVDLAGELEQRLQPGEDVADIRSRVGSRSKVRMTAEAVRVLLIGLHGGVGQQIGPDSVVARRHGIGSARRPGGSCHDVVAAYVAAGQHGEYV